jgi:hypothetical protein
MLALRRAGFVLLVAGGISLALLLTSTGQSAAHRAVATQPAPLDHYTCYPASSSPAFPTTTVSLVDQFETKSTLVMGVQSLCAPTSKNGGAVNRPSAHLVCHKIQDAPGQAPFQPVNVAITNQFTPTGAQTVLHVTASSSLCLPSLKSLRGPPSSTAPLPQISHYKCYLAKQTSPTFTPIVVSLKDQFGTSKPTAFSPTRLCNPVSKNGGEIFTQEHLVCYPIRIVAFIRHQLASLKLTDTMGRTLCLPSTKTVLPG